MQKEKVQIDCEKSAHLSIFTKQDCNHFLSIESRPLSIESNAVFQSRGSLFQTKSVDKKCGQTTEIFQTFD